VVDGRTGEGRITAVIEVASLSRSYAGITALDAVSFTVARGEVVGLLGPNGAGKTTCLRVLACFVPPSQGTARIDGLDVARASLEVRARLGYLPEGVPLYPELRVEEHLTFRARLRGLAGARRRAAVDRAVERCGLGPVRRRIVGQLSRGYRQRVGLADALLAEPPVLILDEPTVGLDPNQLREVRELIRGLGGEHTVLLSTHVLPEVEAVCSRVLVLHHGRLVAQEPVAALRARGAGALILQARCEGALEPALGALAEVPGVREVSVLEPPPALRCRLLGEVGPEVRERVVAAAQAAGLHLQELRHEAASLEEVFARLTAEDAGEPGGGP